MKKVRDQWLSTQIKHYANPIAEVHARGEYGPDMDEVLKDERLVLSDLHDRGIDAPALADSYWETARLDAVPVLCHWLDEPIDDRAKLLILV